MRYLTAAETRDTGVLLEVNRRLLHPRGLAIQTAIATEDDRVHTLDLTTSGCEDLIRLIEWMRARVEATDQAPHTGAWLDWLDALRVRAAAALEQTDAAILRVRDHRDDPEGVYFGDLDEGDTDKAVRFEGLLDDLGRAGNRLREFGYVVQPLPALPEATS